MSSPVSLPFTLFISNIATPLTYYLNPAVDHFGPGYVFELIAVAAGVIVTFFRTNVDVCTGSFCFCCTAIVVEAYRRKIFEAAVLFSRSWIDRLFLCLLLSAAAAAADPLWLLLLALSSRCAEFRKFFPITVAVVVVELPPDPADDVPVLSLLLTIRNNRPLREIGPSVVPPVALAEFPVMFVATAVSLPLAVVPILATNRCNTAVVGAVGSAFRLCLLLLLWWFL